MDLDSVLEAVTVGSLGLAFLVFLVRTGRRQQPGPHTSTDFGVVFGAFLAAWAATELFHVFAVEVIREVGEAVHFLLLLSLALWLNARFYAALRHAKRGA